MSVERQLRRLRRRVVLLRFIGAFTEFPVRLCNVAIALCHAIGGFFSDVDKALFYLELDAARQYRALTGVDLALGAGEAGRYSGLAEDSAEQRDDLVRRRNSQ